MLDGFTLAAAASGDGRAERATDALATEPARAVRARIEELSVLDSAARKAELQRAARSLRPAIAEDAPLPPRARALLAAEAPRELGARWIAEAPAPRRGFVASPSLRAALRGIATQLSRAPSPAPHRAGAAGVAGHERGAGRVLLARISAALHSDDRARILRSLGAEEAAAVMALAAHPGDSSAPAAKPTALERGLLAAAMREQLGAELTRALGALGLGAVGDTSQGDAWSDRWRRAGSEIAGLEGACLE